MYRFFALTIFCFAFGTIAKAQKVLLNFDVNPKWENFSEIIDVWTKYLQAPTDSAGAQYWNEAEVSQYGIENYNLMNHEYNPSFHRLIKVYTAQILSITENNGLYKITTQFYYPKHDTLMTLCIMNVYAKKEGDEFKLYNARNTVVKKDWQTRTMGYLKYHYPSSHEFDEAKALKQNRFITNTLPELFGCTPDTVNYFFAETRKQLDELKGFEFNVGGSGTEKPSGKTIGNNVYTTGTDEYYPHELVHVFINPMYPDMHNWASEGIATYLGGSRGQSLQWHINRSAEYLAQHPEVDLSKMLDLQTMDEYTDYRYILGGAIIQLIHDKENCKAVKEFLAETTSDDESYYAAIEKHLGWKRSEINKKFRRALKKMAED